VPEAPYVAFDVTPLQNGHRVRGIGTYVRGLAAQLLSQDEVPIEFWGWADDPPLEPRPPHRGWWLPRLGVPRTRFPSLLRIAMSARCAVSGAGVVHITDPNALVVPEARRMMTTVYDLIPLHQGRSAETPGYRRYLSRLQSVGTIFAISEATAQDVVATLSVPQGRVVVARPGVEIPPRDDSAPAPVPGKFFLYVGSPDPHKNVGLLLEAIKLCRDLPEKLVIAGNWPEQNVEALRSIADADPALRERVEHLGYVTPDELLALFHSCTAVVMPSLIEGFGLPVAEAMAAGAAVVHSSLAVLDEVSAGCALTFAPTSATELAACLRKVSTDEALRHNLIARSRLRAETLTWRDALERTLRAYRVALDGGGRD